MSIDKQIEEMARVMCPFGKECGQKSCKGCGIAHEDEYWHAKRLYNASYRKSQDVAEEIFAEIEKIVHKQYNRSLFGIVTDITPEIAKLKKKYTESENDNGKM